MTEWRIKEVSDMTKTSIRMLRYYDKMGLLTPSYRSSNGYRYYTAQDLAKLQQIIALKYFGFSLNTIKTILQKHHNIYAHLHAQHEVLKKQSMHLQHVNAALEDILKQLSPSEIPNWHDLITLIESYHMTENLREKLKKTWAGQSLTEEQFEAHLVMYELFPKEFAECDKIIAQLNNNELGDPTGPDGERVASFMHDFAKKITKKLSSKAFEFSASVLASMKSGKLTQLPSTPEATMWISRATVSFWLKRWNALYNQIVKNLKSNPESAVGKKIALEWTGLIDEYFSMGSKSLYIGMFLWQECARQDFELKELKKPLTPKEMIKPYHIPLVLNPEAVSWISRALERHTK